MTSKIINHYIKLLQTDHIMTEIISDLATDLADSYDNQAASPSPPSASQIYRTGRVLYHYHHRHHRDSSSPNNSTSDNNLIDGFDQLLSTLPTSLLTTVILHDINYAFGELIFSYASSHSVPSSTVLLSSIGSMLPLRAHATKLSSSYTWEDVVNGTESICGIYLSRLACAALLVPITIDDEEKDGNEDRTKLLQLVFLSLSWVYDCLSSSSDDNIGADNDADMEHSILHSLSRLLTIGLVRGSSEDEDDDENLTNIMNTIQKLQASLGEYNCALGDMLDKEQQQQQQNDTSQDSFVNTLRSTFTSKDASQQQPPQLQYLLAMLRSSPRSSDDDAKPAAAAAVPSSTTTAEDIELNAQPLQKQQNMVDIQIDHIQSILPNLGDGYIEEALKCYNHDMGRTLEALLQFSEESGSGGTTYNNIHPRLRTLPKNLPRQLKKSVDHYTANVDLHRGATAKEDGKEHVERQKELIRNEVRRAEEEALMVENVSRALGGLKVTSGAEQDYSADEDDYFQSNRNEYDDDYDDQYDGIGNDGGIGMDEGLYDIDTHSIHQKYDRGGAKNEQEMWRKYNRLIKDVESESSFWEENKNLNRSGGYKKGTIKAGNTDDGEEKKYRGPEKGKKGRLIGPDGKYLPIKRGGKKANPGRGGSNPERGGEKNAGRGGGGGGKPGAGKPQGDPKQGDGSDDMSKVQKRRKNDNKAKIGNHHRKDRATKKASGGMM